MATSAPRLRPDAALLGLSFAVRLPLELWALAVGPVPWLSGEPSLWPGLLAYGIAALWVAFLLWARRPRARLAAYVFLTLDTVRSVRRSHWLFLAVDIAVLLYLQTTPMRRLYPPMWDRARKLWRTRARG